MSHHAVGTIPLTPIDLNQIAEQIRAEGYAAGYEACYRDLTTFLQSRRGTATVAAKSLGVSRDLLNPDNEPEPYTEAAGRAPRGQTLFMVRGALKALGDRQMTVKEIQAAVHNAHGVIPPYSSVQNTLFRMLHAGEVELIRKGVWKPKTNTAPSTEIEEAV